MGTQDPSLDVPGSAAVHLNRRVRPRTHGGAGGRGGQPPLPPRSFSREAHKKPANDLLYAARQERDDEARKAKQREIVEKYYASKWYPLVKGWLK